MRTVKSTSLALLLCICLGLLHAQADTLQPPANPNLKLPVIAGLQGTELDPETVPASGLDITVQGLGVDSTVVLLFQTTLTLYLADDQGNTIAPPVNWPISARNAGKPVTLPIARSYLESNAGKTLQVYYTVAQPRSAPQRSGAVAVLLKEGFAAAQALDLSRHNYIVFSDSEGVVKVPPTPPDYAYYTRVQPGAVQYASDNDAIARVDGNGRVSIWGNGSVTITATTAAGAASSYTLTVSGVRQLQLLSLAYQSTWEQAKELAIARGYSLPTEQDLQVLVQLYSPAPGTFARTFDLGPYAVWGEWLGAGTAVYLDLYDDLVTSGYASEFDLGYPAVIR